MLTIASGCRALAIAARWSTHGPKALSLPREGPCEPPIGLTALGFAARWPVLAVDSPIETAEVLRRVAGFAPLGVGVGQCIDAGEG